MKTVSIILALVAVVMAIGMAYPRLGKSSILKTMDARMTTREFSSKPIDDKTLDEILWAAFGRNSRGTRTIPTSRNAQDLKVFAIRADGAFFYDGEKLNKVSDEDLRPLFAERQAFVMDAPLTLLFAGSDRQSSPMHAGSSYQNVALYCAERGLGNVVRAYFDKAGVERALGFPKDEFAIISQTIGWKK